MLGNPHETPLFPLPDFNLVAGGDVLYGNEKVNLDAGMCVWTFVRSYESDIFTSQGDARKTGANFCNLVITFVLRRRAAYYIRSIVPIVFIFGLSSAAAIRIPLHDVPTDNDDLSAMDAVATASVRELGYSRINFLATFILAAVAFQFTISTDMPHNESSHYIEKCFYMFDTS